MQEKPVRYVVYYEHPKYKAPLYIGKIEVGTCTYPFIYSFTVTPDIFQAERAVDFTTARDLLDEYSEHLQRMGLEAPELFIRELDWASEYDVFGAD